MTSPQGILVPLCVGTDGSVKPRIDSPANDHVNEHVFVRLVPRETFGSWYPAPFGYGLVHGNGIGPIDGFGLRIAHDLHALAERKPERKLILVFGGSAVHSMEMPHHLTFPFRLEERLNAGARANGLACRFSVLNFGLSGCHVMNEMFLYLMLGEELRPDAVVVHDGFNDLAVGMINDPVLVHRYGMSYPPNHEVWTRMLLGGSRDALSQDFDGTAAYRIRSGPQSIVDSFLRRKEQFHRIVESAGAMFVWGLQPVAFGKTLSPEEREAHERFYEQNGVYKDVFRSLPVAYDFLQARLAERTMIPFVNTHRDFAMAGEDEVLFSDIVHLTADGSERLAEIYARHIFARFPLTALSKPDIPPVSLEAQP